MEKHTILGIHITNRMTRAQDVQKVFSEFGCNIRTRLGLHDVAKSACSPNGLILLEIVGKDAEIARMAKKLKAIKGVQIKKMVFTHP